MCSILGIADFKSNISISDTLVEAMGKTMAHRGPDSSNTIRFNNVIFHHNRLAVIDVENGKQPMNAIYNGNNYTIIYNGELYNTNELRNNLEAEGAVFKTNCDTEVVLFSYIIWGNECSSHLNGIFAFAIYDERKALLYISRDRLGVKPLFYTLIESNDKCTLIFASEIKALLKHPNVKPQINNEGLWQLIFLSPMRLEGSAIFKGISEICAGFHGTFSRGGLKLTDYWSLKASEISDNISTVTEKTRFLLKDAITRQLVSDVPLCTFLSGGLDSSVITAVAAGSASLIKPLSTYSFEYEDNKKHFKASFLQPQSDDEYAVYTADYLSTEHTILTASVEDIINLLNEALVCRDYPGMADIDSSLLYYCRQIKKKHTVALSGECSDEIFGGYPWFYRDEMLNSDYFPWIHDIKGRMDLFLPDETASKKGLDYVKSLYVSSVQSIPFLNNDSPAMLKSRKATYLSVKWFMSQLLERKDRMSMASGLEVRVPFADHRILEYVYNIPWEYKYVNNVEKSLLRDAMSSFLPERVLKRKKSPYPKTQNPIYGEAVLNKLKVKLSKSGSLINQILRSNAIDLIIEKPDKTWFGQLMSRPQLMAWLLQLDYWFSEYNIDLI